MDLTNTQQLILESLIKKAEECPFDEIGLADLNQKISEAIYSLDYNPMFPRLEVDK